MYSMETADSQEKDLSARTHTNHDSITTATSPGTRTLSTQSTESVKTVREGDASVPTPKRLLSTTPSYPFPIASRTPLLTPDVHQPFTNLSPTVTPSPAKAAKHKISQEFKASGLLRTYHGPSLDSPREAGHGSASLSRPNLLEVAVHLQSEPGLAHWWNYVTKILKEHFAVERAALAVATDATDVENVPWAQLATFWPGDEDQLSRVTNDAESSRGSLRGVASPHPTTSEKDKSPSGLLLTRLKPTGQGLSSLSIAPARPKLETRHSYAGYPSRHKPAFSDTGVQVTSATTQRSLSPIFTASGALRDPLAAEPAMNLNEELLRLHNDKLVVGSISDDFLVERASSGKILQPPQPLESEADPLITTSGILRVLGKDRPIILTREYFNYEQEARESNDPGSQGRKNPAKLQPKTKRSPGLFKSRPAAKDKKKRPVASSARSSLAVENTSSRPSARRVTQNSAYEDYEQFPGTPWSQSPAPSPAARAEPDDNPFFTHQPDQDAFAENPPEHPYSTQSPIAAIGIDRSRTIIQIPLIHPSGRFSHTVSVGRAREDSTPKALNSRGQRDGLPNVRQGSYMSSEPSAARRVPIAILSVLAPNVPYPQEMIDALNEMAPLLATSFYAARSHSNILRELSAISGRRRPGGLGFGGKDPQMFTGSTGSIGLNFDRSRDSTFSATSPLSSASASTQSTSFQISKDTGSSFSAVPSPALDASFEDSRRQSLEKPASSAEDAGRDTMDYFSRSLQSDEKARTPLTPSRGGASSRPATSATKKKFIHSQGASFATTQPSLPPAAASATDDGTDGDTAAELATFKEPSSSVLRTMIDNGATQQFIAEPEHGRLIWANSKFMAYRNASKDNIHEQLWTNIYPKDISRFQKEWNKSLETGEQLSHQVRLKRFDGHYRYFHMRFLPLKDRYGVTKYWHGQAMDIHDLHEAEVKAAKSKEKLASEARYRALANSLPVIVFAASVPAGMTFANTQWLLYSGQDLEEALGFGFLEHVHPDDLVKCRFPGFDPSSKGPPERLRPMAPQWSRNDSSVSSTAESEGTTTTVKASKELKEANAELAIPNELLRELADDKVILCAKDQQGNLSITTEMRLKNRKGEYGWHLVQGSYIDSVNFGQGEAQWFIACTDISNQKQNEAKIQQANSALEDVNSALEKEMKQKMNYLSSMSHEIRTPLNGIIGNLQFLLNSGLDESAADWAHGAQEAARNMHELINDILDLSKAEANMLQLASHWFSPRDLMEQVLDMLNSKVAEKVIELSIECDEEVPQSIRGDSTRMRQVLLNLVGNAIKFTREGEVTIKCDVLDELPPGFKLPEARADERFIRWSVIDTGMGFTPDDRKLLFKPYSQLKNKITRDSGGTGLGLTLCKTMVTLHGGAIDATSKPGLGSTFTFFARFRVRSDKGHTKASKSQSAPQAVAAAAILDLKPQSPSARSITASEGARDSPAILSDSSSVRSVASSDAKPSVRSSASTADSGHAPIKLTMPLHPTAPRSPDVSLSPLTKSAEPVALAKMPDLKAPGLKPTSPRGASHKGSPVMPPRGSSLQRTVSMDLERANFRPPMISALVVCFADNARRVTCDQIRTAVPRSVPCNIASQTTVDGALGLLTGNEPVIFTHIVLRLAENDAMLRAVRCIMAEPRHSRACIVVLAHQEQAKYLQGNAPDLSLEELSKQDRLKMVMKPAHNFKLAKIFDPFNENALASKDPKEAKRQKEKSLQKEAYDLFKEIMGNKGIRVMAVEDNALQMNILHNFLGKICCLDVTKAWNGKECFELFKAKGPGYYSVIVTDIEMPVMDGLSMCRRVRDFEEKNKWPPINLVSLSAHTFSEGWNQSSEAGFSHYCPKPVQFRDLGHILLELTDPSIPHKFLRERQMPRPILKKLGLLPLDEVDSEEDDDE